jgi:hypothetical protein
VNSRLSKENKMREIDAKEWFDAIRRDVERKRKIIHCGRFRAFFL